MKTDDPLSDRLSALPIPPPDPAARDRALHRATLALQATGRTNPDRTRPWVSLLSSRGWTFAGAAVAVFVLVSLWTAFNARRPDREQPPSLAAEGVMLRQMETLFGPQLAAIVEHPGGAPDIRLSTGDAATAPGSLAQPVLIQFRRAGDRTTRVLSYSGRTVCVTLAGRRMCFEPLVTGGGGVILNGERFCWTSDQPSNGPDGYRVTARPLPRS